MIYPTIGTDGDRSQGAMDDVWAPVGVAAVLVDTKWKISGTLIHLFIGTTKTNHNSDLLIEDLGVRKLN